MICFLRQRRIAVILAGIAFWAAGLRVWRLDSLQPGLQVDEASNAWNAYCLLKTGQDEWGHRWPIFYTRAFDDYRSATYLYALLPFQLVGGMNVYTTRLPAAAGGVATVLLIYYIGKRLFDQSTGLIAAAILASCPWHVQYSRLGHEAALTPFLSSAAIAALLWAGVPCVAEPGGRTPRAWAGFAAGVISGVACYGYPALRLALPVTLIVGLCATARCWIEAMRQAVWRKFIVALVAGLAVTAGPLAWAHLSDADMNRRGHLSTVWSQSDTASQRVLKTAARYPAHFGPTFLFERCTLDFAFALPQGYGCFNWYVFPLLLCGAATLLIQGRSSMPSRLVAAMLLSYPAGDLTFGMNDLPHSLRSFHGVIPLSLTAAIGAVAAWRWLLARRKRQFAHALGAVLAICALGSHLIYIQAFAGRDFNENPAGYGQRNVHLMRACQWLAPRLDAIDDVFITQEGIAFPHGPALVFLNYDPRRWFSQPRLYEPGTPTLQAREVCSQFGNIRIMYRPRESLRELRKLSQDGRRHRTVLILAPDQTPGPHLPVYEVRAGGIVWLRVYELELCGLRI